MIHYFTTCQVHELPTAIELSKQIENLTVAIIDRKQDIGTNTKYFSDNIRHIFLDEILPINDINILHQKYTTSEINKIAKCLFFNYLYYKIDTKFLFFISPKSYPHCPQGIVDNFLLKDIFLLPKTTLPYEHTDEKQILNSGMFDSGFVGVRKSTSATQFLDWWNKRVIEQGYINPCEGTNGDELWLNHVPVLFDNVQILRDKSFLAKPLQIKNLSKPLPSIGRYEPPKPFMWLCQPIIKAATATSRSIDKLLRNIGFMIWG